MNTHKKILKKKHLTLLSRIVSCFTVFAFFVTNVAWGWYYYDDIKDRDHQPGASYQDSWAPPEVAEPVQPASPVDINNPVVSMNQWLTDFISMSSDSQMQTLLDLNLGLEPEQMDNLLSSLTSITFNPSSDAQQLDANINDWLLSFASMSEENRADTLAGLGFDYGAVTAQSVTPETQPDTMDQIFNNLDEAIASGDMNRIDQAFNSALGFMNMLNDDAKQDYLNSLIDRLSAAVGINDNIKAGLIKTLADNISLLNNLDVKQELFSKLIDIAATINDSSVRAGTLNSLINNIEASFTGTGVRGAGAAVAGLLDNIIDVAAGLDDANKAQVVKAIAGLVGRIENRVLSEAGKSSLYIQLIDVAGGIQNDTLKAELIESLSENISKLTMPNVKAPLFNKLINLASGITDSSVKADVLKGLALDIEHSFIMDQSIFSQGAGSAAVRLLEKIIDVSGSLADGNKAELVGIITGIVERIPSSVIRDEIKSSIYGKLIDLAATVENESVRAGLITDISDSVSKLQNPLVKKELFNRLIDKAAAITDQESRAEALKGITQSVEKGFEYSGLMSVVSVREKAVLLDRILSETHTLDQEHRNGLISVISSAINSLPDSARKRDLQSRVAGLIERPANQAVRGPAYRDVALKGRVSRQQRGGEYRRARPEQEATGADAVKQATIDWLNEYLNASPERQREMLKELGLNPDDVTFEFTRANVNALIKILQTTQNVINCAAEALSNLLDQLGISHSKEEIATSAILIDILTGSLTTEDLESGKPLQTTMFAIQKVAMEKYGVELHANEAGFDDLAAYVNAGNSVIVHIGGDVGHYVVVTGIENGMVTYVDIDGQSHTISQDEFNQMGGTFNILSQRNIGRELNKQETQELKGARGGGGGRSGGRSGFSRVFGMVVMVAAVVATIYTGGLAAQALFSTVMGAGGLAATAVVAGCTLVTGTVIGTVAGLVQGYSLSDSFKMGIQMGVTSAIMVGLGGLPSWANPGNVAIKGALSSVGTTVSSEFASSTFGNIVGNATVKFISGTVGGTVMGLINGQSLGDALKTGVKMGVASAAYSVISDSIKNIFSPGNGVPDTQANSPVDNGSTQSLESGNSGWLSSFTHSAVGKTLISMGGNMFTNAAMQYITTGKVDWGSAFSSSLVPSLFTAAASFGPTRGWMENLSDWYQNNTFLQEASRVTGMIRMYYQFSGQQMDSGMGSLVDMMGMFSSVMGAVDSALAVNYAMEGKSFTGQYDEGGSRVFTDNKSGFVSVASFFTQSAGLQMQYNSALISYYSMELRSLMEGYQPGSYGPTLYFGGQAYYGGSSGGGDTARIRELQEKIGKLSNSYQGFSIFQRMIGTALGVSNFIGEVGKAGNNGLSKQAANILVGVAENVSGAMVDYYSIHNEAAPIWASWMYAFSATYTTVNTFLQWMNVGSAVDIIGLNRNSIITSLFFKIANMLDAWAGVTRAGREVRQDADNQSLSTLERIAAGFRFIGYYFDLKGVLKQAKLRSKVEQLGANTEENQLKAQLVMAGVATMDEVRNMNLAQVNNLYRSAVLDLLLGKDVPLSQATRSQLAAVDLWISGALTKSEALKAKESMAKLKEVLYNRLGIAQGANDPLIDLLIAGRITIEDAEIMARLRIMADKDPKTKKSEYSTEAIWAVDLFRRGLITEVMLRAYLDGDYISDANRSRIVGRFTVNTPAARHLLGMDLKDILGANISDAQIAELMDTLMDKLGTMMNEMGLLEGADTTLKQYQALASLLTGDYGAALAKIYTELKALGVDVANKEFRYADLLVGIGLVNGKLTIENLKNLYGQDGIIKLDALRALFTEYIKANSDIMKALKLDSGFSEQQVIAAIERLIQAESKITGSKGALPEEIKAKLLFALSTIWKYESLLDVKNGAELDEMDVVVNMLLSMGAIRHESLSEYYDENGKVSSLDKIKEIFSLYVNDTNNPIIRQLMDKLNKKDLDALIDMFKDKTLASKDREAAVSFYMDVVGTVVERGRLVLKAREQGAITDAQMEEFMTLKGYTALTAYFNGYVEGGEALNKFMNRKKVTRKITQDGNTLAITSWLKEGPKGSFDIGLDVTFNDGTTKYTSDKYSLSFRRLTDSSGNEVMMLHIMDKQGQEVETATNLMYKVVLPVGPGKASIQKADGTYYEYIKNTGNEGKIIYNVVKGVITEEPKTQIYLPVIAAFEAGFFQFPSEAAWVDAEIVQIGNKTYAAVAGKDIFVVKDGESGEWTFINKDTARQDKSISLNNGALYVNTTAGEYFGNKLKVAPINGSNIDIKNIRDVKIKVKINSAGQVESITNIDKIHFSMGEGEEAATGVIRSGSRWDVSVDANGARTMKIISGFLDEIVGKAIFNKFTEGGASPTKKPEGVPSPTEKTGGGASPTEKPDLPGNRGVIKTVFGDDGKLKSASIAGTSEKKARIQIVNGNINLFAEGSVFYEGSVLPQGTVTSGDLLLLGERYTGRMKDGEKVTDLVFVAAEGRAQMTIETERGDFIVTYSVNGITGSDMKPDLTKVDLGKITQNPQFNGLEISEGGSIIVHYAVKQVDIDGRSVSVLATNAKGEYIVESTEYDLTAQNVATGEDLKYTETVTMQGRVRGSGSAMEVYNEETKLWVPASKMPFIHREISFTDGSGKDIELSRAPPIRTTDGKTILLSKDMGRFYVVSGSNVSLQQKLSEEYELDMAGLPKGKKVTIQLFRGRGIQNGKGTYTTEPYIRVTHYMEQKNGKTSREITIDFCGGKVFVLNNDPEIEKRTGKPFPEIAKEPDHRDWSMITGQAYGNIANVNESGNMLLGVEKGNSESYALTNSGEVYGYDSRYGLIALDSGSMMKLAGRDGNPETLWIANKDIVYGFGSDGVLTLKGRTGGTGYLESGKIVRAGDKLYFGVTATESRRVSFIGPADSSVKHSQSDYYIAKGEIISMYALSGDASAGFDIGASLSEVSGIDTGIVDQQTGKKITASWNAVNRLHVPEGTTLNLKTKNHGWVEFQVNIEGGLEPTDTDLDAGDIVMAGTIRGTVTTYTLNSIDFNRVNGTFMVNADVMLATDASIKGMECDVTQLMGGKPGKDQKKNENTDNAFTVDFNSVSGQNHMNITSRQDGSGFMATFGLSEAIAGNIENIHFEKFLGGTEARISAGSELSINGIEYRVAGRDISGKVTVKNGKVTFNEMSIIHLDTDSSLAQMISVLDKDNRFRAGSVTVVEDMLVELSDGRSFEFTRTQNFYYRLVRVTYQGRGGFAATAGRTKMEERLQKNTNIEGSGAHAIDGLEIETDFMGTTVDLTKRQVTVERTTIRKMADGIAGVLEGLSGAASYAVGGASWLLGKATDGISWGVTLGNYSEEGGLVGGAYSAFNHGSDAFHATAELFSGMSYGDFDKLPGGQKALLITLGAIDGILNIATVVLTLTGIGGLIAGGISRITSGATSVLAQSVKTACFNAIRTTVQSKLGGMVVRMAVANTARTIISDVVNNSDMSRDNKFIINRVLDIMVIVAGGWGGGSAEELGKGLLEKGTRAVVSSWKWYALGAAAGAGAGAIWAHSQGAEGIEYLGYMGLGVIGGLVSVAVIGIAKEVIRSSVLSFKNIYMAGTRAGWDMSRMNISLGSAALRASIPVATGIVGGAVSYYFAHDNSFKGFSVFDASFMTGFLVGALAGPSLVRTFTGIGGGLGGRLTLAEVRGAFTLAAIQNTIVSSVRIVRDIAFFQMGIDLVLGGLSRLGGGIDMPEWAIPLGSLKLLGVGQSKNDPDSNVFYLLGFTIQFKKSGSFNDLIQETLNKGYMSIYNPQVWAFAFTVGLLHPVVGKFFQNIPGLGRIVAWSEERSLFEITGKGAVSRFTERVLDFFWEEGVQEFIPGLFFNTFLGNGQLSQILQEMFDRTPGGGSTTALTFANEMGAEVVNQIEAISQMSVKEAQETGAALLTEVGIDYEVNLGYATAPMVALAVSIEIGVFNAAGRDSTLSQEEISAKSQEISAQLRSQIFEDMSALTSLGELAVRLSADQQLNFAFGAGGAIRLIPGLQISEELTSEQVAILTEAGNFDVALAYVQGVIPLIEMAQQILEAKNKKGLSQERLDEIRTIASNLQRNIVQVVQNLPGWKAYADARMADSVAVENIRDASVLAKLLQATIEDADYTGDRGEASVKLEFVKVIARALSGFMGSEGGITVENIDSLIEELKPLFTAESGIGDVMSEQEFRSMLVAYVNDNGSIKTITQLLELLVSLDALNDLQLKEMVDQFREQAMEKLPSHFMAEYSSKMANLGAFIASSDLSMDTKQDTLVSITSRLTETISSMDILSLNRDQIADMCYNLSAMGYAIASLDNAELMSVFNSLLNSNPALTIALQRWARVIAADKTADGYISETYRKIRKGENETTEEMNVKMVAAAAFLFGMAKRSLAEYGMEEVQSIMNLIESDTEGRYNNSIRLALINYASMLVASGRTAEGGADSIVDILNQMEKQLEELVKDRDLTGDSRSRNMLRDSIRRSFGYSEISSASIREFMSEDRAGEEQVRTKVKTDEWSDRVNSGMRDAEKEMFEMVLSGLAGQSDLDTLFARNSRGQVSNFEARVKQLTESHFMVAELLAQLSEKELKSILELKGNELKQALNRLLAGSVSESSRRTEIVEGAVSNMQLVSGMVRTFSRLRSESSSAEAYGENMERVKDIIYARLALQGQKMAQLHRFLGDVGITVDPSSGLTEGAVLADIYRQLAGVLKGDITLENLFTSAENIEMISEKLITIISETPGVQVRQDVFGGLISKNLSGRELAAKLRSNKSLYKAVVGRLFLQAAIMSLSDRYYGSEFDNMREGMLKDSPEILNGVYNRVIGSIVEGYASVPVTEKSETSDNMIRWTLLANSYSLFNVMNAAVDEAQAGFWLRGGQDEAMRLAMSKGFSALAATSLGKTVISLLSTGLWRSMDMALGHKQLYGIYTDTEGNSQAYSSGRAGTGFEHRHMAYLLGFKAVESVDTLYREKNQGTQDKRGQAVERLAELSGRGGREDVLIVTDYQAEQFMGLDTTIQDLLMAERLEDGTELDMRKVFDEGDMIWMMRNQAINSESSDATIGLARARAQEEFIRRLRASDVADMRETTVEDINNADGAAFGYIRKDQGVFVHLNDAAIEEIVRMGRGIEVEDESGKKVTFNFDRFQIDRLLTGLGKNLVTDSNVVAEVEPTGDREVKLKLYVQQGSARTSMVSSSKEEQGATAYKYNEMVRLAVQRLAASDQYGIDLDLTDAEYDISDTFIEDLATTYGIEPDGGDVNRQSKKMHKEQLEKLKEAFNTYNQTRYITGEEDARAVLDSAVASFIETHTIGIPGLEASVTSNRADRNTIRAVENDRVRSSLESFSVELLSEDMDMLAKGLSIALPYTANLFARRGKNGQLEITDVFGETLGSIRISGNFDLGDINEALNSNKDMLAALSKPVTLTATAGTEGFAILNEQNRVIDLGSSEFNDEQSGRYESLIERNGGIFSLDRADEVSRLAATSRRGSGKDMLAMIETNSSHEREAVRQAVEYAEEAIENEPVLMYGRNTQVVDMMQEGFRENGRDVHVIDAALLEAEIYKGASILDTIEIFEREAEKYKRGDVIRFGTDASPEILNKLAEIFAERGLIVITARQDCARGKDFKGKMTQISVGADTFQSTQWWLQWTGRSGRSGETARWIQFTYRDRTDRVIEEGVKMYDSMRTHFEALRDHYNAQYEATRSEEGLDPLEKQRMLDSYSKRAEEAERTLSELERARIEGAANLDSMEALHLSLELNSARIFSESRLYHLRARIAAMGSDVVMQEASGMVREAILESLGSGDTAGRETPQQLYERFEQLERSSRNAQEEAQYKRIRDMIPGSLLTLRSQLTSARLRIMNRSTTDSSLKQSDAIAGEFATGDESVVGALESVGREIVDTLADLQSAIGSVNSPLARQIQDSLNRAFGEITEFNSQVNGLRDGVRPEAAETANTALDSVQTLASRGNGSSIIELAANWMENHRVAPGASSPSSDNQVRTMARKAAEARGEEVSGESDFSLDTLGAAVSFLADTEGISDRDMAILKQNISVRIARLSDLEKIKGVGPATVRKLVSVFGSREAALSRLNSMTVAEMEEFLRDNSFASNVIEALANGMELSKAEKIIFVLARQIENMGESEKQRFYDNIHIYPPDGPPDGKIRIGNSLQMAMNLYLYSDLDFELYGGRSFDRLRDISAMKEQLKGYLTEDMGIRYYAGIIDKISAAGDEAYLRFAMDNVRPGLDATKSEIDDWNRGAYLARMNGARIARVRAILDSEGITADARKKLATLLERMERKAAVAMKAQSARDAGMVKQGWLGLRTSRAEKALSRKALEGLASDEGMFRLMAFLELSGVTAVYDLESALEADSVLRGLLGEKSRQPSMATAYEINTLDDKGLSDSQVLKYRLNYYQQYGDKSLRSFAADYSKLAQGKSNPLAGVDLPQEILDKIDISEQPVTADEVVTLAESAGLETWRAFEAAGYSRETAEKMAEEYSGLYEKYADSGSATPDDGSFVKNITLEELSGLSGISGAVYNAKLNSLRNGYGKDMEEMKSSLAEGLEKLGINDFMLDTSGRGSRVSDGIIYLSPTMYEAVSSVLKKSSDKALNILGILASLYESNGASSMDKLGESMIAAGKELDMSPRETVAVLLMLEGINSGFEGGIDKYVSGRLKEIGISGIVKKEVLAHVKEYEGFLGEKQLITGSRSRGYMEAGKKKFNMLRKKELSGVARVVSSIVNRFTNTVVNHTALLPGIASGEITAISAYVLGEEESMLEKLSRRIAIIMSGGGSREQIIDSNIIESMLSAT